MSIEFLREIHNSLHRKLELLGWLDDELKARGYREMPVLVGGTAVELYTHQSYASVDIDVVYGNAALIGEILEGEGFKKEGRYWACDELNLVLECPDDAFTGVVSPVKLNSGRIVYVSSVEDMIIDRLNACVHWRSESDCQWARVLFESARELDMAYLREMASRDEVLEALENMRQGRR